MVHDMTKGRPFKLLLSFAVPHFMGLLLQQMYGIMDSIAVGRILGAEALAAVGSSTHIFNLITMGACTAMTGFSSVIAHRLGAKDENGIKQAFFVSLVMMGIASAVLYIVSFSVYRPLLVMSNTPEELLADASGYISTFIYGIFFMMLYNLLAGAIRAMGNSKLPFYILIGSSVCNVVMNFALLLLMKRVEAAAISTVLAQIISCILAIVVIAKKFPELHIKKENRKFDRQIAKSCLKIGVPMFLQSSLISGGGLIGQSARNLFGTAVIVGFSSLTRINSIMFGAFASVGAAMLTYVNQNMGAGNKIRVHQGVKCACRMSFTAAVVYSVIMFFFGKWLTLLFVGSDSPIAEEMMACVQYYTYFLIPGFLCVSQIEGIRNTLHGIGLSFVPVLACGQELITRSLMAYLAAKYESYTIVCMAEPLTWSLAVIPLIVAYIWWYRKHIRPMKAQANEMSMNA